MVVKIILILVLIAIITVATIFVYQFLQGVWKGIANVLGTFQAMGHWFTSQFANCFSGTYPAGPRIEACLLSAGIIVGIIGGVVAVASKFVASKSKAAEAVEGEQPGTIDKLVRNVQEFVGTLSDKTIDVETAAEAALRRNLLNEIVDIVSTKQLSPADISSMKEVWTDLHADVISSEAGLPEDLRNDLDAKEPIRDFP